MTHLRKARKNRPAGEAAQEGCARRMEPRGEKAGADKR